MSQRLKIILDKPTSPEEVQRKHGWNPDDKSPNIVIFDSDELTLYRQPVAQSTDCIRGKVGYESGLHVFDIRWPIKQRGTHPLIGVSTAEAALQKRGYQNLLGDTKHSWGWHLGNTRIFHDTCDESAGTLYPCHIEPNKTFPIPERFKMVLDMDEGVLGFVVDGQYLGPACTGLRGKKLYVTVSTVWGQCHVTMKYYGGYDRSVVPLAEICRFVIRQKIGKKGIKHGKIEKLPHLPKVIKTYLSHDQTREKSDLRFSETF